MPHQNTYSFDFCYAYDKPLSSALSRVEIDDFIVHEELGFSPSNEGEHIYIQIKKRNQNTQWIAKEIAKFIGVTPRDVGYCGLKDRFAETTQWFSIYDPKKAVLNWSEFSIEGVNILQTARHTFKLKPGMHEVNKFLIRLREIICDDHLKDRLEKIKNGVPNYFGEQRFGIDGNNLPQAESLLIRRQSIKNKKLRGLIISAARSYLFNTVLSERVSNANWLFSLKGEPESFPTAPMWGRGRPLSSETALKFESSALKNLSDLANGLEHVGLNQERRPLISVPYDFQYEIEKNENDKLEENLVVHFSLLPGQYATSVLREIAQVENYQRRG
ncbi:MAG: tRNA pseudouridine(13) synthase TruD [Cellvibrionaceae bacterium]